MTGDIEHVAAGTPDVTPPESIDFVGHIRALVAVGDTQRRAMVAAEDWESLAWGYTRLSQVRRVLSDLLREVETDLYRIMPDKKQTVSGVGTLEKKRGSNRKKWQSAELVSHLVRLALDPEGTGEIPADPMEAAGKVVEVLTACAPFTGSLGWRATALRDWGIDPDEWCETTPGRESIRVHGEVEQ